MVHLFGLACILFMVEFAKWLIGGEVWCLRLSFCLFVQKTNVSHLNIRSSLLEQAKQSGGWTCVCSITTSLVEPFLFSVQNKFVAKLRPLLLPFCKISDYCRSAPGVFRGGFRAW